MNKFTNDFINHIASFDATFEEVKSEENNQLVMDLLKTYNPRFIVHFVYGISKKTGLPFTYVAKRFLNEIKGGLSYSHNNQIITNQILWERAVGNTELLEQMITDCFNRIIKTKDIRHNLEVLYGKN